MWAVVAGVLSGLLSGLLSGVMGNIVAHRLAVRRAQRERTETTGGYVGALKAEMRDNVNLCAKPIIGDAKVMLLTKQWEQARPFAESLPPSLLDPIREAYVEVARYNSSVEYERANVPRGHGYMDNQLRDQANAARSALEQALAALGQSERQSGSSRG